MAPHVTIALTASGFRVERLDVPGIVVEFKDYGRGEGFTQNEAKTASYPSSRRVLVGTKDQVAHIIAKDPSIRVEVRGQHGVAENLAPLPVPKPIEPIAQIPIAKPPEPIIEIPEIKTEIIEPLIIQEPEKKKIKKKQEDLIIPPSSAPLQAATSRLDMATQLTIAGKNIAYIMKSDLLHAALICGGTGLGKSFLVEDLLTEILLMKRDLDYIVYKGSMTEGGLFRTLAQNSTKTIIMDDCDSVWGDKNSMNMLKGGLESTVPKINKKGYGYIVHYRIPETDLGDGEILESLESNIPIDDAEDEDTARKLFGVRVLNPIVTKGKSKKTRAVEITGIVKVELEFSRPYRFVSKVNIHGHTGIPIRFDGKLIFVSNLPLSAYNTAVKTRMRISHFEFTREEIQEYIYIKRTFLMPHIKNDELKLQVLEFYKDNIKLPLDLRSYSAAIETARDNPTDWQDMLLAYEGQFG